MVLISDQININTCLNIDEVAERFMLNSLINRHMDKSGAISLLSLFLERLEYRDEKRSSSIKALSEGSLGVSSPAPHRGVKQHLYTVHILVRCSYMPLLF